MRLLQWVGLPLRFSSPRSETFPTWTKELSMRFIVKRRAPLAVVAALAMTLIWAAPASAAVGLTVTPNTNLVDFQTVSVTGTGFPATTGVGLLECQTGAFDLSACDLNTL